MNLIDRFTNLLRGKRPSALRNKPGGIAWIRISDRAALQLNGRIVTTVRSDERGFWTVDPVQSFTLSDFSVNVRGSIVPPGAAVELLSIADDCLITIPDTGVTDEEVADLFAPKQPEVVA